MRVNGLACVMHDEDILAVASAGGKQPVIGIGVEIEECYFQCAKAIMRSGLWNGEDHGKQVPTAGQFLRESRMMQ